MPTTPSGPQSGVKYTVTGPDGTKAVFNDSTDPDFVGYITETTGLDSPEIRENAETLAGQDGGVHGNFLYGRRPMTLSGSIVNIVSAEERNKRLTKMKQALNAMRADAKIEWTPAGGEAQYVKVRCQQPIRVTGGWAKDFQIAVISADCRIYSVAESTGEVALSEPADTAAPTEAQFIATSPDGKHVYALSGAAATPKLFVYSRNSETGHLKKEEEVLVEANSKSMAFSLDGKVLYIAGNAKVSWFKRNETTGALTSKETIAAGVEAFDLAVSEKLVACTNKGANTVSVYTRNTGTGVLTLATTVSVKVPAGPVTVLLTSSMLFVQGPSKIAYWAANETTGAVTFVAEFVVSNAVGMLLVKHTAHVASGKITDTFYLGVTSSSGGTGSYNVYSATYKEGSGTGALNSAGPSEIGWTPSPFMALTERETRRVLIPDEARARIIQISGVTLNPKLEGYAPSGSKPTSIAVCHKAITEAEEVEGKISVWSAYSSNFTGKTVSEFETPSTGVLVRRWSTNIKISCNNKGNMETFPVFTLKTASTLIVTPSIINSKTGESINFASGPQEYDELIIDTLNRTIVRKLSAAGSESVYSLLEYASSQWFALQPGENEILFSAFSIAGAGGTLSVKWRNAWV